MQHWGCRTTLIPFGPPYPWFRVWDRSRRSRPDQVDHWEGVLQFCWINFPENDWPQLQKHMGPRSFQIQITGPKMWSAPTKTGLPYNFCFIKFLPSCKVEAEDAPQTLFRAPLTLGAWLQGQLRTFPPSKYIPLPNFTKIGLAVQISIRIIYKDL